MAHPPKAVTLLGGGLTSLAFAHRLTTLSPSTKITLLEAAPRLGGWLSTVSLPLTDGSSACIEEGPRSVRPKGRGAPRLLGMVHDLGLQDEVITVGKDHPSAKNRFLVHPTPGALLKLPSSPTSLLSTDIGRALALAGVKEPFQPVSDASDESVDSFFRRRFGPKVADSVASAMVHGIYACSSKDLSVRSAFPYLFNAERARGSVLKALAFGIPESDAEKAEAKADAARWDALGAWGQELKKQSVWGLKGGLGTLTAALERTLRSRGVEFRLEEPVQSLRLTAEGVEVTTCRTTYKSDTAVSTLPPHLLDRVLPSGHGLPHLNANPLTTVSVLTFVFPASTSAHPYHPAGFGYLIPRSTTPNELGVLGVVFDSTAMGASDKPEVQNKIVKLTMMIGGPYYTSGVVPIAADPRSLIPAALAHLRSTLPDLPRSLEPLAVYAKTHKDCIPTYTPGHGSRMRDVHEAISANEWRGRLAVAGAGWGGVSLGDCTENGGGLAEALCEAGAHKITGLERWKAWDAYSARAQPTSAPLSFPSKRSYSTFSRSELGSRFSRGCISRSGARSYASSSSAPPRPSAPLALRATVSILGFILVLYAIWFGIVIVANLPYILQQIYGAMKGNEVKEWKQAEGEKPIMLDDIKGMGEVKDEVREFIEFLKDPDSFASLGGRATRGVLLSGPPGTGKTMLARAVAGEAGVPFFYASGSEFEDTYVGVGAMRIRQMFSVAKERAPSIIFIDELDSIGAKRSDGEHDIDAAASGGGGEASRRQTLNELLAHLDGFSSDEDVVVIAATNFPETLDEALIRPGRFDRHIHVPLPDVQGRLEILKHYAARLIVDPSLDLSIIARGTPGLAGADLENLTNLAAIRASREGASAVQLSHLDWARDRLLMGAERRSRFIAEESLRLSAYIEAGRALVASTTEGSVPLHKVSLMPRGSKLSITSQVPGMDQDSISRKEYIARLDVAVAGRVAEELLNGSERLSDRTAEDLDRASKLASAMVREMGFSEKVGLVSIDREQMPFLSKARKDEIESEIRRLVDASAARARALLTRRRKDLDRLAAALREHETLTAAEVGAVLRGEAVPPRPPAPAARRVAKVEAPEGMVKGRPAAPVGDENQAGEEARREGGRKPVQWLAEAQGMR